MPKIENRRPQKIASPVDIHVGGRVRLRRRQIGLSQQALAEQLGLTFQQVQKYERAANRISASKLYDAGRVLGVPVSYFFEGLEQAKPSEESTQQRRIREFMNSDVGFDCADIMSRLPVDMRHDFLDFATKIGRLESPVGEDPRMMRGVRSPERAAP